MKKSRIIFVIAILCSCILVASCDDEDTTESFVRDGSLAGSISFVDRYYIKAEGSYDSSPLENLQSNSSWLDIHKVSDTEISLFCYTVWGKTIFSISIPVVALGGKPYDVTFDDTSSQASIRYDNTDYPVAHTSIKGWIKEVKKHQVSGAGSYNDPATPDYLCEIRIDCTQDDGKVLHLKIISVKP